MTVHSKYYYALTESKTRLNNCLWDSLIDLNADIEGILNTIETPDTKKKNMDKFETQVRKLSELTKVFDAAYHEIAKPRYIPKYKRDAIIKYIQFKYRAIKIIQILLIHYKITKKNLITKQFIQQELNVFMLNTHMKDMALNDLISFLRNNNIIETVSWKPISYQLKNFKENEDWIPQIQKYCRIIEHEDVPKHFKERVNTRLIEERTTTCIDRTGMFEFEYTTIEDIMFELQELEAAVNSEDPTLSIKTISGTLRTVIEYLCQDLKTRERKLGFLEHVSKRFSIKDDDNFYNFIQKIWKMTSNVMHARTMNYCYKNNCGTNMVLRKRFKIGLISYYLTTLFDIFNSSDIKMFGFNLDTKTITNLLNKIHDDWGYYLDTIGAGTDQVLIKNLLWCYDLPLPN